MILDSSRLEYSGSSTDQNYETVLEKYGYTVELLSTHETYKEANLEERRLHILYDVVASPEYFNKINAVESNYADPDYATYKHTLTGKVARLPRNHPKVLSGEWVGVTKGLKISHEGNKPKYGEENHFYGKKHSEETKALISLKNTGATLGIPKTAEHRSNISNALKGKPKSEEHKAKNRGKVMLQNIDTLEIVRVDKILVGVEYDPKIWVNPKKIKPDRREFCIHCGIESNVGNIRRWHNDNCKSLKENK